MSAVQAVGRPCLASMTPRLSDDEIVELAVMLLRDSRAWVAAGFVDLAGETRKDAARRAARLLREALATV